MTKTHVIVINNIEKSPEQIKKNIEMKWVDVNVYSVESQGEFTAISINDKGFKHIEKHSKDGNYTKTIEKIVK